MGPVSGSPELSRNGIQTSPGSTSNGSTLNFLSWNSNFGDTLTASAFIVVMLFTVFGSFLILIAIRKSKNTNLRFTTHCYTASLALGNLLMAVVVMPIRVISFLNKPSWIQSPELCEVYSCVFVFCCTLTVLSMAAMSVDRYFSVPRSAKYQKFLSNWRVFGIIVCLWLVSAVVSFVPAEFNAQVTKPTWDCKLNRIYNRAFVYSFVTIEVLTPVILMLAVHCRITKATMNQFRSVDVTGRKVKNLDYSQVPTLTHEATWAKVVIKIIFSFIIFWIPRCIFLLLDNSQHNSIHEVADGMTEILTYCFGASLALLLSYWSDDYKNELMLMLCPFVWYQRKQHERKYQVTTHNTVGPGVTPATMYRKYSMNSFHPR